MIPERKYSREKTNFLKISWTLISFQKKNGNISKHILSTRSRKFGNKLINETEMQEDLSFRSDQFNLEVERVDKNETADFRFQRVYNRPHGKCFQQSVSEPSDFHTIWLAHRLAKLSVNNNDDNDDDGDDNDGRSL